MCMHYRAKPTETEVVNYRTSKLYLDMTRDRSIYRNHAGLRLST